MSEFESTRTVDLYPNLGAEEGSDWSGYRAHPAVRSAAHLWCLLFGSNARLRTANESGSWTDTARDALWPAALGDAPSLPAFAFLAQISGPIAWLNTEALAQAPDIDSATPLSGPAPRVVSRVHDKAFAVSAARDLGLTHRSLTPLIEVLDPDELRHPASLLARLGSDLEAWPEWTGRRFTLKPRFGSSGRGRVGGRDQVDTPSVRGALPRLADHGGAVFEPWLDRTGDYSVTLLVPGEAEPDVLPTILGSLEMWSSPAGLYLGHCGEVDSRGRVFSGDPEDESLRADAAAVASLARSRGFFGVCGVDSFRYRAPMDPARPPLESMRGAVEFNARATMGLVTIGLVRRALTQVRGPLELTPGDRRGFALVYRDPQDEDWRSRLRATLGAETITLDLSETVRGTDPRPTLLFTRDPDALRQARREILDC